MKRLLIILLVLLINTPVFAGSVQQKHLAVIAAGGVEEEESSQFVFDVTVTEGDLDFTFPTIDDGTYDCNVDWGDSTDDDITEHDDDAWTHSYSSADTYTITITGTCYGMRFNNGGDKLKIVDVSDWGPGVFRLGATIGGHFYGCSNMTTSATNGPDATGVTDMRSMFSNCSSADPDVSGFDTSSVTDMRNMFNGCSSADPDVSGFDTSSVTNMSSMFYGCSSADPDVSGFDTSSVADMGSMFSNCSSADPDVSGFDTSSVTSMGFMFYGCSSADPDVSGFDTSSVTYMRNMFNGCSSADPDVSGFDTSSVANMGYMFNGCSSADPDVSGFDTSSVTDMSNMFYTSGWGDEHYSKALVAWSQQSSLPSGNFHSGTAKYFLGASTTAKEILDTSLGTMSDGGQHTYLTYPSMIEYIKPLVSDVKPRIARLITHNLFIAPDCIPQ